MISDTSLKKLVIPEDKYEVARKWFQKRDWVSIKGRILIDPFDSKNLGPFNYDLCVGNEVFALKSKRKLSLRIGEEVFIEPGDIFLVLTQEYLGLPREFAASSMPRFKLVREGIIQSMTKIDPTWYGKIAVAIANHSNSRYGLREGQAFCTLILHKLDKPVSKVLNVKDKPALGKESIDYFVAKEQTI